MQGGPPGGGQDVRPSFSRHTHAPPPASLTPPPLRVGTGVPAASSARATPARTSPWSWRWDGSRRRRAGSSRLCPASKCAWNRMPAAKRGKGLTDSDARVWPPAARRRGTPRAGRSRRRSRSPRSRPRTRSCLARRVHRRPRPHRAHCPTNRPPAAYAGVPPDSPRASHAATRRCASAMPSSIAVCRVPVAGPSPTA